MTAIDSYYQTADGIVRQRGDELQLLAGGHGLADLAAQGRLSELEELAVADALEALPGVLQPALRPSRLFLVGLNYMSHAEEVGQPRPEKLLWMESDAGSVAAPSEGLPLPALAPHQLDYEGEIVVVLGRSVSDETEASASSAIGALTAGIDFTARDLQMRALQGGIDPVAMRAAKSFVGAKPIGPGLLLPRRGAAVPDVELRTQVNGQLRQRCRLSDQVFPLARVIAEIAQNTTLQPGDVIFTGTPAGVGFVRRQFLAPGDIVEVCLGSLPPLRATVRA